MGKLRKIMQIQDDDQRLLALLEYAKSLGIIANYMNFEGMKRLYKESAIVEDIRKIEHHKEIIKTTFFAIVFSIITAYFGWGWIESTFIYPPKYKIKANLSRVYADEYRINLIVKNIHRGSGEITKPNLIIYSDSPRKSFIIEPTTKFVGECKTNGNVQSCSTIDTGKIIKVAGYGLVNEAFEYRIRDKSKYRDGIEGIKSFIEQYQDNLKYKISGYPYSEIEVYLSNEN